LTELRFYIPLNTQNGSFRDAFKANLLANTKETKSDTNKVENTTQAARWWFGIVVASIITKLLNVDPG